MTLHLRRIAPAFIPILLIVLFAALLAACAQPAMTPSQEAPAAGEPETENVLVRAMTSEPAKIDPQGPPSAGLSLIMPYLFDTLVARDVDNTVLPFLAESWTVAEDGLTITMTLKSGVTFQDGEPLNAEAVRFTFERFKTSGRSSPIYSSIQQIDAIEAVDDLTVRFRFVAPAANFWSTITMPYAGIISPASAEKFDSAGEGYLIGTGAFILDDWQAGQSITLRRNPEYNWAPSMVDNQGPPYLDALVFKVIPDASTQLAALSAGEVDVIFINEPSHLQQLTEDPQVEIHETVLNGLVHLGFNVRRAPFDEATVRRALSHAVDKQQILDLALGGLGRLAFAPLPPTLPGFDPALQEYEIVYDLEEAKRLLQEAGFSATDDGGWERDGRRLQGRLLTSTRAPNEAIATVLQSQFLAIGIPVEIQQLDSKAVMEATTQGDFDLLLWRYEWNDPDALNIFLSSDRIGTTNRVGYSNPEVDNLLAQAAGEMDEDKRYALYVEAQKIILQDAPWQPLYNPVDAMAMTRRVEGVTIGYMGRMLVNDAKVAE